MFASGYVNKKPWLVGVKADLAVVRNLHDHVIMAKIVYQINSCFTFSPKRIETYQQTNSYVIFSSPYCNIIFQ